MADFGLTKLTEAGSGTGVVGTFGYMSPEYAPDPHMKLN